MIKEAIAKVVERIDLSETEAEETMREIMEGAATSAQIAAYTTALRMKGECLSEICGSAKVMREKSTKIRVGDPNVVDTCGTGGDGSRTFNISTTVAFVLAGAGVTVAKHGNRSVSSLCGSADVLKALGVKIDLPVDRVEDCINKIGIGFLFAPLFHSAMKYAAIPRQEIGIRTLFNILGPLTNPAGASVQVMGVFSRMLTDMLAQVLVNLGSRHCFVVHGSGGLDEISISGNSQIAEGKDGRVASYFITPEELGLPIGKQEELLGGGPDENAVILRSVLKGEKGPKRNIVLMNAAPALVAVGLSRNLKEAVTVAEEAIDSGNAEEKLSLLCEVTNR
ncbi:MAG: anthranilate phosphoribosyltransferase [Nitrospirota bacterium]